MFLLIPFPIIFLGFLCFALYILYNDLSTVIFILFIITKRRITFHMNSHVKGYPSVILNYILISDISSIPAHTISDRSQPN